MWREHEIYTEIRKVSGSEKSEVLPKMSETLAAGALGHAICAPRAQNSIYMPILPQTGKIA